LRLQDYTDVSQRGDSPILVTWRQATDEGVSLYEGSEADNFGSGIRARTALTGSLIGVTGFAAFMSASSSMSVAGLKVVGHSSDLTATSALSATISQTISGDIDLASECTQSTAISVIYDHTAALNSQVDFYLDPDFLITLPPLL
jgi:hypothetical protein